jgi:hypothetical protein
MRHEVIERLINYWRVTLFVEPFVVLSFTISFIIGLIYHRKNREKFLFLIYFFAGIILFVQNPVLMVCKLLTGRQLAIRQEASNTVFELAEFIAFYYFFKKSLRNNTSKRILKTSLYILSTIIAAFLVGLTFANYSITHIRVHSLVVNVIEFFFLFIMCLAYFRELFTDIPTKNLFTRSSFLIVTSTFFYAILMIPFFLIANDILTETAIYSTLSACHYLLLIVLLFSISKAFLCKQPITS